MVFQIANKLLHRSETPPLPPMDDKKLLADQFNEFFVMKVDRIMDSLSASDTNSTNDNYIEEDFLTSLRLTNFRPITLQGTIDLIKSATPKCCELDPIQTSIILKHVETIAPTIQKIINLSIPMGIMPGNLKEAILRPLLKKLNLDPQQLKNFRPVSNLSYVSKLVKCAVCNQLMEYAEKTGNLEEMQSAYRVGHSTETALLKVKTDILNNMDQRRVTFLVLLDLLATFDLVSFKLLLNCLHYRFGVTGTALKWIASYLTNRTQRVKIDDMEFDPVTLIRGVPQGSVLGPILYTLFTSSLGNLSRLRSSTRSYSIDYYGYADDTQNYHSFSPMIPGDKQLCLEELESCIQDVQIWMRTNLLKLNNDKTEFLIIGTPQQLAKVRTTSIKIGTDPIQCSESAHNLGYFYDSTIKSCTHINKLSSMLYIIIKRISRIRHTIDLDTTKTLVQALVTTKLDYCNSLMMGTPGYNISKLQHIQNAAARVVYGKRFVFHITPYLKELHWLKVTERITYKIACIMYKCVNGTAAKYLQELVLKNHNRTLKII